MFSTETGYGLDDRGLGAIPFLYITLQFLIITKYLGMQSFLKSDSMQLYMI